MPPPRFSDELPPAQVQTLANAGVRLISATPALVPWNPDWWLSAFFGTMDARLLRSAAILGLDVTGNEGEFPRFVVVWWEGAPRFAHVNYPPTFFGALMRRLNTLPVARGDMLFKHLLQENGFALAETRAARLGAADASMTFACDICALVTGATAAKLEEQLLGGEMPVVTVLRALFLVLDVLLAGSFSRNSRAFAGKELLTPLLPAGEQAEDVGARFLAALSGSQAAVKAGVTEMANTAVAATSTAMEIATAGATELASAAATAHPGPNKVVAEAVASETAKTITPLSSWFVQHGARSTATIFVSIVCFELYLVGVQRQTLQAAMANGFKSVLRLVTSVVTANLLGALGGWLGGGLGSSGSSAGSFIGFFVGAIVSSTLTTWTMNNILLAYKGGRGE